MSDKQIKELIIERYNLTPAYAQNFLDEKPDPNVRVVNSTIYTLKCFQKQMASEASAAGFMTEEDINDWITRSRREENTACE